MAWDGSIRINTKLSGAGFDTGIKSMMSSLGPLAAVLAAVFAVDKLVDFSKKILTTAADFQRLQLAARIVGGTYGYTAEEVKQLTGDLVASGIQTDIANKAFINFAREGLDTNFLPALARGAQDLAVFAESGESSSDMFDRLLQGVLNLNPLMLRTAGVAVDLVDADNKWAAANGTVAASMSIQEKRQAALIAVTEKLTGVNGLYEMGQKTAAGQMQSNIRIMNELWAAMGAPFQNALYTVVKGFNDLVKAFTAAIGPGGQLYGVMQNIASVAGVLAQSIAGLFNSIMSFFGITTTAATELQDGAAQTQASLEGAATNAGALASNTEAAGKAATKSLASFDKLNVLTQASGGGGGSGEVPVVPGLPLKPVAGALDIIQEKIDTFFAAITMLLQPAIDAFDRLKLALDPLKDFVVQGLQDFYDDFLVPVGKWVMGEGLPRFIDAITNGLGLVDWPKLNKALADLWSALSPLTITIFSGLLWFFENVLVPLAAWTISNLLPAFLDLLTAALGLLNIVLVAAAPLVEWLFNTFLVPLAQWTGGVIVSILQALTDVVNWLGQAIEDHQEGFRNFLLIVAALAAGFVFAPLVVAVATALGGFITAAEGAIAIAVYYATVFGLAETATVGLATAISAMGGTAAGPIGLMIAGLVMMVAWWNSGKIAADENTGALVVNQAAIDQQAAASARLEERYRAVSGLAQTFTQDEVDMKEAVDNVAGAQADYDLALSTNTGLDIATTKLGDAKQAVIDLQTEQDLQTKKWVLNILTQQLSIDGLTSAEFGFLLQYQVDNGIISTTAQTRAQDVYDSALKMAGGMDEVTKAAGGTDGALRALPNPTVTITTNQEGIDVPGLTTDINNIPTNKTVTIDVVYGPGAAAGSLGMGHDAAGGSVQPGGWAVVGDSLSGRRTGFEELVHALPGGGFQVFPNSSLGGLGIPYLASGTVIPANAPFAAILGDNKSQKEILAPEDMIRRIVREESGSQKNQNITIEFGGSMSALIGVLQPYIVRENGRIGTSLVGRSGA